MNASEAEKIVQAYGGVFASDPSIARKRSALPCSKARVRLAILIYIEGLVKLRMLTQELGESLVGVYAGLERFVDDDLADSINTTQSLFGTDRARTPSEEQQRSELTSEQRRQWNEFLRHKFIGSDARDEINEYISEIQDRSTPHKS